MDDKYIVLGIIAIVLVVGLAVFYVSLGDDDIGPVEEYTVTLNQTTAGAETTEEFARIVSYDGESIVISGQIQGNNSAQYVVLEDYYIESETLHFNVTTKSEDVDGAVLPVVMGYGYEINVNNISDVNQFEIHTDKNTFELNSNDFEDGTKEYNESNRGFGLSIEDVESTGNTTDYVETKVDGYSIQVDGRIVGSSGGMNVNIDNYYVYNNELIIDVSLDEPDGMATTVVTGYEYTIEGNVSEMVEDVKVNHSGDIKEQKYEFETGSEDGVTVDKRELAVLNNTEPIEVKGMFTTGSSSCSKAGLDDWYVDNGTLHIEMSPHAQLNDDGEVPIVCTADLSPDTYNFTYKGGEDIESVSITANDRMEGEINEVLEIDE